MQLACPQCRHVLEFSGERPSFCAYCGQPLTRAPLESTAALDPQAATSALLAPGEGGAVPQQVGGYRLLRPLGTGGMGTVYEAEETATGRRAALKLIAPEFAADRDAVERFRREGRLASAIAHPRCVFVLAAEEEAGRPYIVMELMPGATLEDLVEEQGPLPPAGAVAKILDVIEGLEEAHLLGVVHRDVKPSNCFLDADGRVKVGDFGLAKSLAGDARLTKTGAFMGTPLFASPEQVKGEPVDPQTDVYSAAATLYFLLTGRAPFQTGDAASTLARIVSEPPPPLRGLRPDVPPALERVVLRGLERDRRRRWRSLGPMRAALLPFAPGQLTIGGMGMRLAAYLLDWLLFQVVWAAPAALVGMWGRGSWLANLLLTLLVDASWVGYFALLEGVWGCSLGKRLLRLRICPADGTEPPGVARSLARVVYFYCLTGLGRLVGTAVGLAYLPDVPEGQAQEEYLKEHWGVFMLATNLPWVWLVAGIVLLVSTMRARNGYRGLHEFLSGTRVLQLPWPRKRRRFRGRRPDADLSRPAGLPERIGPFAVRGAARWGPAEKVLLGEDEALGRRVWVWLRPAADPPLSPARRALGRMTRPRWLAGGRQADLQWDAFLALPGCPLPELVAGEEKLPWPDVRTMLEQLTDELDQACQDGTLPGRLAADQVWVQPDGRVQLLDTPLSAPAEVGGQDREGGTDQERALALLRQVAVLALEGHPRAEGEPPAPVRAPVPEHADHMLNRLTGVQQPYEHVGQVRADLAATRDRPAEVNRAIRAGHLALLTAFLAPGLLFMFMASLVMPAVIGVEETAARQEAGTAPDRPAEGPAEDAAPEPPSPHVALIIVSSAMTALMPFLWVVWAFLVRGGFTFRMAGISVARSRGGKAGRLRCAWRALLVWGPLTLVLVASFWAVLGTGASLRAEDFVKASMLGWMGALILLVVYAVLALVFPRRGPHDFLAGTCLVPR